MTMPAQPLDLNRVAVFLKVVDEGGITAAARALSLPKSSVSRAVSLLEEELGARLLRRASRSVAPSEAGAAFYERATRGMSLLSEAREAVVDLDAQLRGPIRVTAAVDVGVWVLAPLIAGFGALHPAVTVDVVLTGRLVDLQEEGIDFGLRAGVLRDESLVARKLSHSDFALYASPDYVRSHGAPKRVAELAQHRCVLFRPTRGQATWTLTGPRGSESVRVQGAVQADDFSFVLQALASGAGIGLLPTFVAERGGGARLERVLPRHAAPGAPLHLVYPKQRYMPQRMAVFRDYLLASQPRTAR